MDNVLTSEEIFNILTDSGKNIADYKDKHFRQNVIANDFILVGGEIKSEKIMCGKVKVDLSALRGNNII